MMSAQTVTQTPTAVRQIFVRYRWTIALALLSVVTALVAYRFTSARAVATSVISSSQVSYVDPAQQGVLDYLRAHQTVAKSRSLDPTQQGVLDYLRVHSSVQPLPTALVSLEPVQQGVMSYLRAHHTVENRLVDPAQQGVMDYLRAHNH
jgi:hypothetical protein